MGSLKSVIRLAKFIDIFFKKGDAWTFVNLSQTLSCEDKKISQKFQWLFMSKRKRIAIYPGTFDPVTYGHLDVLERACRLFDEVIVAIAVNANKQPIFSQKERKALIEANVKKMPQVKVEMFDGLTIDFAEKLKACAIIRGLRAVSDFEYEFQMAQMNRHMDNEIETIFLMPSQAHFYTSSKLIKSVSQFSVEDVAAFVPKNVKEALEKHFNRFK